MCATQIPVYCTCIKVKQLETDWCYLTFFLETTDQLTDDLVEVYSTMHRAI